MKTTRDILDIVLITFNRAPQFEKTLEMLFAPDSPVRNCALTILDNKSTDETPQIAERYASLYPNVKHHVNNFNVGGNANIAKALEMYGAKPYHWVICDDDVYNWEGWSEVEEAMQRGEKLICVGDTDGVDSNGNIIIIGGTVNVTGQSSFDYDGKHVDG